MSRTTSRRSILPPMLWPLLLLPLLLLPLLSSPLPVHGIAALSKRGVCMAAADELSDAQRCVDLQAMQVSWYYNWYIRASCASPSRLPAAEFVPMIYDAGAIPIPALRDDSQWLLGFNEPNMATGANLSPAAAAALWPALEQTGRRLVGPAVADCGPGLGGGCIASSVEWYREFLAQCKGCRINAVAMHAYYCDARDQLRKIKALYEVVRKPIWLTQFACNAPSDAAQPKRFAEEMLPELEAMEIVSRYAWFISYCNGCEADGLLHSSLLSSQGRGALTELGRWYAQSASESPLTLSTQRARVAIDCGAEAMGWDSRGEHWFADDLYSTSTHTRSLISNTPVALPAMSGNESTIPTSLPLPDSFVLQSMRVGESTYTLPVAEAGSYTLRLFFSDPESTGAAQRVFRILVQGQAVDDSVDVFVRAGGAHRAYELTLPAVAVDEGSQPTPMALTVALRMGSAGLPLIAGLVLNGSTAPSTGAPDSPYFLNLGASDEVTDSLGRTWQPGTPFISGGGPAVATHPISAAPSDLLFVYETYLASQFEVRLPARATGSWRVTLLFAESYWRAAGQRVFQLWVQDRVLLMDIAQAAGVDRAHNVSVWVEVPPALPYLVLRTVDVLDRALLCGVIAQREAAPDGMDSDSDAAMSTRPHMLLQLLLLCLWMLLYSANGGC